MLTTSGAPTPKIPPSLPRKFNAVDDVLWQIGELFVLPLVVGDIVVQEDCGKVDGHERDDTRGSEAGVVNPATDVFGDSNRARERAAAATVSEDTLCILMLIFCEAVECDAIY